MVGDGTGVIVTTKPDDLETKIDHTHTKKNKTRGYSKNIRREAEIIFSLQSMSPDDQWFQINTRLNGKT